MEPTHSQPNYGPDASQAIPQPTEDVTQDQSQSASEVPLLTEHSKSPSTDNSTLKRSRLLFVAFPLLNLGIICFVVTAAINPYSYVSYLINSSFGLQLTLYVISGALAVFGLLLSLVRMLYYKDRQWLKVFFASLFPALIFLIALIFAREVIANLANNYLIMNHGDKLYKGDVVSSLTQSKIITELDLRQELVVGTTTLEEVYQLLTKDYGRQLSFASDRYKTIRGRTFKYDKILEYSYNPPEREISRRREGDFVAFTRLTLDDEGNRGWGLVIFIDDGVITHASYKRMIYDGENTLIGDAFGLDFDDSMWPGSAQDILDYEKERGLKR